IMLSGQSPSMLTVNMAWRINSIGDYGTANALGFVSYLLTGLAAWFYLREAVRDKAAQGAPR
ncbi:MAG: sugar ABC transporter permease, partial [Tagaea sp.]